MNLYYFWFPFFLITVWYFDKRNTFHMTSGCIFFPSTHLETWKRRASWDGRHLSPSYGLLCLSTDIFDKRLNYIFLFNTFDMYFCFLVFLFVMSLSLPLQFSLNSWLSNRVLFFTYFFPDNFFIFIEISNSRVVNEEPLINLAFTLLLSCKWCT